MSHLIPARQHPRLGLGVVALALVALAVTPAMVPNSPLQVEVDAARHQPAGVLPWLSVSGTRIVDPESRTVILRGFDSDGLLQYRRGYRDQLLPSDVRLMAAAGFNVVRLAISWSALEPVRGRIDAGYLSRVAATVAMLNRYGLYAVLDMHFSPAFSPRFGGAGAPLWAYVPLVPGFEHSPNYWLRSVISPDALAAYTYFIVSPDWQRDFLKVWRAVAERFRDDPGVAAYDLVNEPHPFPIPPRYFERYWLWPFYVRIMDAIGEVDANHIFVLDNAMLSNLPTETLPVRGAQLVYGPHMYYGVFGWPTSTSSARSVARYIDSLRAEANRIPAPLWIGETSIDRAYPGAKGWLQATLAEYDRLGVGWAWWQWKEATQWAIRQPDGTVDWSELKLLAQPYPAAAPSGITAAWSGSRLTLRVATGPAGVVAVVWPEEFFGPAHVSGSCLAHSRRRDASHIDLRLRPHGACTVIVA